jgi:hypothetical protein
LAAAIVLIGVFAMAVRVPASPDMWWHLRCGEVQWHTRTVLKTETFSYTALGTPWVNQSWLPQLAMHALHTWGGFAALALAVGGTVATTFGLLLISPGRSTPAGPAPGWAAYWRAFVVLWAAISSAPTWAARPHLLTLLFTALWSYLLERWRGSGRRAKDLAWLPPLMLLWANCHGGYVIGVLLLLAEMGGLALDAMRGQRQALAGDARATAPWTHVRTLLLVTLLCLTATLINPQGINLPLYPFRALGSTVQQNAIAEWASPDFHIPDLWPFLVLLLATWAALSLSHRGVTGPDLLRALGFTAMALRSSRYIGLSAVILAPLLIQHAPQFWGIGKRRSGDTELASPQGMKTLASSSTGKTPPRRAFEHSPRGLLSGVPATRGWPIVNWSLLVVVLIGAGLKVAQPLDPGTIDRVHRQRFPIDAAQILWADDQEKSVPQTADAAKRPTAMPSGSAIAVRPELFHEYGWGGYLIWAQARSDVRVFIDGRADPYGDELIKAYQHVMALRPGWEDLLARYDVHTVLLAADSALGAVLRESTAWREVYGDKVATVFVRVVP